MHDAKRIEPQFWENVRYLLWQRDRDRSHWPEILCRVMGGGWDDEQARQFLEDGELTEDEVRDIAEAFNYAEDELRYARLVEQSGANILIENLTYLFEALGHGGKKAVAQALGAHATTISRWLAGSHEPPESTQRHLVEWLGLDADADLRRVAVFLSYLPVSLPARRAWLHGRIDALAPDELRRLYPALRKLLKEP